MIQLQDITRTDSLDPRDIISHQIGISSYHKFLDPSAKAALEAANTIEEANTGYLAISGDLAIERTAKNQSGNNANLKAGRISGENDTIICCTNSQVDKEFLLRAVLDGAINYPLPYQKFDVSKEDFIAWTEKSKTLETWDNQLFALTSASCHIVQKKGELSQSDKDSIWQRIQEFMRLFQYLKADDFSIFMECCPKITKHISHMEEVHQDIIQNLNANDSQELIVNLERLSRILAWIIFLIDETLLLGPESTIKHLSFIERQESSKS